MTMLLKYSDRVYYTAFETETDAPALGYVLGNNYAALIDAGCSPRHINGVLNEIKQQGLRAPDFVFLTHSHWDHSYGLCALNIPSFANKLTYQYLKEDLKKVWNEETFRQYRQNGELDPFIARYMAVEYPDISAVKVVLPNIIYDKELSVDLGGITVVNKVVTNAHSKDGSVIFIPEEKVLFLGDSMSTELVNDEWIDHPELVREYHRELEKMDFEISFPAHFPPKSREEMFAELTERE